MENQENQKIVQAGFGYTIGNYLISGLTFLTIPLFSRLMSTADYGLYNTYIAYENIIYIILGFAIHASFKNAKYKYKEQFHEYISSCTLLALFHLLFWLLVCNVFYFSYGSAVQLSRFIVNLLLLHSFGGALIQYFNSYVGLEYQYKSFLKIAAINAVGNILLSVVLILTACSGNTYYGRAIGTAVPMILLGIYIIWYFFSKAKAKLAPSYWKYAVKYCAPVVPHGVSQILLTQFDRIMIRMMVGASEAGIYSFAYNIFSIIFVTTSSLDNVWGPWFFERMQDKEYGVIKRQSSKYAFGMLLFCGVMLLVSPEMIKVLGAREYWPAVYTVIPIVVGGYFSFLYSIPIQVEYYFEKTIYIAVGTVSCALINFGMNWYFILHFGYIAAAYATLATQFLNFAFHYFLARRIGRRNYFSDWCMLGVTAGIIVLGTASLLLLDY
ncbi:MAG: oligosaccharide flippase family protein, partial [Clostridiaceae bacterium]|nr:oligosaccharide flippase family protein [Clostridiaceae bacterium]